jgi:hypothetical protein
MVENVMAHKLASLAAALAVAALAACQQAPRSERAATVQPIPEGEGAIKWNTPRQETPPAGAATTGTTTTGPATGTTTESGRLPPGATIQWKDEQPPAASEPPTAAPGPTTAPAPSASAAPPAVPPPAQQPAPPGPPIGWRGGMDGDVVQIEIIDRFGHYRVDRVALVSPQGQEYVARELTYFAPSYSSSGGASSVGFGVGGWGGSSSGTSVGLGLGIPLGGFSSSSSDPDRNAPRTVARITPPDPEGYRRNPAGWTVRVRLLDSSGAASVAQFPAPLPPRP